MVWKHFLHKHSAHTVRNASKGKFSVHAALHKQQLNLKLVIWYKICKSVSGFPHFTDTIVLWTTLERAAFLSRTDCLIVAENWKIVALLFFFISPFCDIYSIHSQRPGLVPIWRVRNYKMTTLFLYLSAFPPHIIYQNLHSNRAKYFCNLTLTIPSLTTSARWKKSSGLISFILDKLARQVKISWRGLDTEHHASITCPRSHPL